MKNLFSNTANESTTLNREKSFRYTTGHSNRNRWAPGRTYSQKPLTDSYYREDLIKPQIVFQMANGQIPDLWAVCHEVANSIYHTNAPISAMQFIQPMRRLNSLEPDQAKRFMKNTETRHVLVSNNLFELALIHWKPGKASDIHGHPGGGSVFKLLQGKLEELRYTPEQSPKLLSTTSLRSGSIAYLDDSIAYHQVGNPYGSSAISLHAYLK
jgi:hypothetical protein